MKILLQLIFIMYPYFAGIYGFTCRDIVLDECRTGALCDKKEATEIDDIGKPRIA